MPIAYSYIRMSTADQLKGDSLNRQLQLSKRYAEENGLELDEEFSLQDIGISGFGGENVKKGSLGVILDAVKSGKIKKGSYLLVESLDRLSRENVLKALNVFMEIIDGGINIVTLADNMVYSEDKIIGDWSQLVISLTIMSRAHEESLQKSKRLAAAWESKRKLLSERKGAIFTSRCPAWLRVKSDKTGFEKIPERVKLVQRVFTESLDGLGKSVIAKRLNKEGVETWGKSRFWHPSYIHKILSNPAVLGEFQARKKIENRFVPAGEVISDYYPRVITDDLFYRAEDARSARRCGGGRKGKKVSNLFSRIAKCGYCGSSMRYVNKGKLPKGGSYLVCGSALIGANCYKGYWPYGQFETNFLTLVKEINLKEMLIGKHDASEVDELESRLFVTKKKRLSKASILNNVKQEILEGTDIKTFIDVAKQVEDDVSKLEQEQVQIEVQLRRAIRRKKEAPHNIDEISELVSQLRNYEGDELFQARLKLAHKISALVSRIEILALGDSLLSGDKGFMKKAKQAGLSKENTRRYVVYFSDGTYRAISPHPTDATKYRIMHSPNDPNKEGASLEQFFD